MIIITTSAGAFLFYNAPQAKKLGSITSSALALCLLSSANRETERKHKVRTHKQHKVNVAAGTSNLHVHVRHFRVSTHPAPSLKPPLSLTFSSVFA